MQYPEGPLGGMDLGAAAGAQGLAPTWTNRGRLPHIVASAAGVWDSGLLKAGQSFSFTFAEPGTNGYSCPLHEGMVGTVVVDGAPGQLPAEDRAAVFRSNGSAPALDSPGEAPPVEGPAAPSPAGPAGAAISAPTVSMLDNRFSPEPVSVSVGAVVTWTNDGLTPHITSSKDGLWDSGMITAGQSFSFRFDKSGAYEYVCIFHPDMVGSVTAHDGAAAVQSTAPAAGGADAPDRVSAGEVTKPAADAPESSTGASQQPAGDVSQQPAEPLLLNASRPGAPFPAGAASGYGSRPEAGGGAVPVTVNVVVPGPSAFEIVVLMAAVGAMVTSLFNLFLIVRPRR